MSDTNTVLLDAASFFPEPLEETLAFATAQHGYVRAIRTGHRIRLVFDTRENFRRADDGVANLLSGIKPKWRSQKLPSREVYLTRGVEKGEVREVCWSDGAMIRHLFPVERIARRPEVHFTRLNPENPNYRVEILRIEAWYSLKAWDAADDGLWGDAMAGDMVRSGKGDLNIEGQMACGCLFVQDGKFTTTVSNFRRLADYHDAVSKLAVANEIAA